MECFHSQALGIFPGKVKSPGVPLASPPPQHSELCSAAEGPSLGPGSTNYPMERNNQRVQPPKDTQQGLPGFRGALSTRSASPVQVGDAGSTRQERACTQLTYSPGLLQAQLPRDGNKDGGMSPVPRDRCLNELSLFPLLLLNFISGRVENQPGGLGKNKEHIENPRGQREVALPQPPSQSASANYFLLTAAFRAEKPRWRKDWHPPKALGRAVWSPNP